VTGSVARFFDATAEDYDVLEPWSRHLYLRLHAILRMTLAPVAPEGRLPRRPRALDAGCGTGLQAAELAALGYRVHGADLAIRLLAVARRERRLGALAVADVAALPYPEASFEVVTCCGSTLSFVPEPALAIRELSRVLVPGGQLLVETEHRWSLDLGWALLSALLGDPLGYGLSWREALAPIASPRARGCWIRYPGYPPLRLFTRAELDGLLRTAGLEPLQWWGVHAATNLVPSTLLHRPRLSRGLDALYRGLCVVDRALASRAAGRALANSLVVLARRPGGTPARLPSPVLSPTGGPC
jgi:SAM-dependent methyltransferase